MNAKRSTPQRRGFTIRDLAATLACLLVGAGVLFSLTGANRNLTQAQVCANNLRQLFTGMTVYVNQYNSYPPHAPWPQYLTFEDVGAAKLKTNGWDPNIGFIITHGLGLQPPRTDTITGQFKWYGIDFEDIPDVCKCPSLPAALLDPNNPEIPDPTFDGIDPLETVAYQYALSYQTSGTCRAATRLVTLGTSGYASMGGRNPPIPDPSSVTTAQQANNTQRTCPPYVYAFQKKTSEPDKPTNTGNELCCWIQAVHPAEVQQPSRVYYLADSKDYRPQPKGQMYSKPPAGYNNGWSVGWGNTIYMGTRHFSYPNVLYLDGRVSRSDLVHTGSWNLSFTGGTRGENMDWWRVSTFRTDVRLAGIRKQVPTMPVLMVKGWEYFFDANGQAAK